jgi:hypothetical protein
LDLDAIGERRGPPSIGFSVESRTSTWKPSVLPPGSCEVYFSSPITIVFWPADAPAALVS